MKIKIIGLRIERLTNLTKTTLCVSVRSFLYEILVEPKKITVEKVSNFNKGFNYVPITDNTYCELPLDMGCLMYDNPFTYTRSDWDFSIDLKVFKPNARCMKEKPVWIFYGKSGLGKSTLASYLSNNYTVFETDSVERLPDLIQADVVILGNKNKEIKLHNVCNCLPSDVKVIKVNFDELVFNPSKLYPITNSYNPLLLEGTYPDW